MLVIMDMEWYEKSGRIFPTQLSAMRVLPDWKEWYRFDRIMRPLMIPDWSFMAFNGYTSDEFLSACTATSVMNSFSMWLSPKDILCWWSADPAIKFIALYKTLHKQPIKNQIKTISSVFDKMGVRQISESVSLYDLKTKLEIFSEGIDHRSSDDVELIRCILENQKIEVTDILKNDLPPHSFDRKQWEVCKRNTAPELANRQHYVIDSKTSLVHISDCPAIINSSGLIRVPAMDKCMKKTLKPCSCCKEVFWQCSYRMDQAIINKCNYSFVFSDSGLFHKPSCMHVRHIMPSTLRGSVRYSTAIKNGYKPCGWCKPKQKDEIEPPHIIDFGRTPVDTETIHDQGNGSPNARKQRANTRKKESYSATRELSDEELWALERHKQAAKERALVPDDLVGVAEHDAHVLSRSVYAFWAAKGYQNFHLRNCPKLAHLSDLYGYATFADAKKIGLTPCKICKPTSKYDILVSVPIYQQQREKESVNDLDKLCDDNGWKHSYQNEEYIIETVVGKWKIIPGTSPVDVYHINKVKTPGNQDEYHRQHRLFLSMTDTLEYIDRHDSKLLAREYEKNPTNIPNKFDF